MNSKAVKYGYRGPPTECLLVGDALSIVLRIARYAGAAPLRFTATDAGWRIAVSKPLRVFQCVFMTAVNLTSVIALTLDFHEDPSKRILFGESYVTIFVRAADLALVLAIASLSVYRGSGRMQKLIRLLTQVHKINADLNNTGCMKMEKITVIAVISIMPTILIIELVDAYIWIKHCINKGYKWPIMAMYWTYYVANYIGLLTLLEWGLVTLAVHSAAAAVNQRLLTLHHVKLKTNETATLKVYTSPPKPFVNCFTDISPPGSDFTAYPWQVQSMVRRLASSYGHIGELMRQMNETNGMMIMAILMAAFLHLVVTPYYLLLNLHSGVRVAEALLVPFIWSLLHITVLMGTVEPCHWMQEQREATKFLLSRVTVRLAPKSKLLARELYQFAKQTILTNVKFSPLGVLTLGRPLVASILGGAVTYLVILMQFHALTDQ